jgi:phosphoribosylglycinamide formyltransferase-1
VGADRDGTLAVERARKLDVPTFVVRLKEFPDRDAWDAALSDAVGAHAPDLVVLAGFMKLVGSAFMRRFGGRTLNTHPALSPAFPGMHGPRDALAHGVKITGCTLFLVDDGVDTGPIIAQASVPVLDDDDEGSLHERIKTVERQMLVDTIGKMAREGWTVIGRKVTIP